MRRKADWKYLVIFIAIPLIVGAISGFIAKNSMSVYKTLTLPPLAPPGFVFTIVWTILYILMGIASYLVYAAHQPLTGTALILYGIQLMVNFFWPIIFFIMRLYLIAFIWLILLILLVMVMLILFYKIDKRHKIRPAAAYLIMPYFLWLLFAAYLNFRIYVLNQ